MSIDSRPYGGSPANYPLSDRLTPALTTIEQFPEKLGEQGIDLLLRRSRLSAAEEAALPYASVLIPAQLVIRDSCAAPLHACR